MSSLGPPYRIVTERTVIRCWDPRDAPLLKDAIDVSLAHLSPWLPWAAREPTSITEKIALLRRFRGEFDLEQDQVYGVFDAEERIVLGGTGLHARSDETDVREIGYWIRADRTRQGLTTEVAAALVRVGFEVHDLHRIDIRCDPRNEASARVAAKLGFVHEATLRLRQLPGATSPRDTMIWSLLGTEYATSPAADAKLSACGAAGETILAR